MGWMKTTESLKRIPGMIFNGRLSYDFDGIPLAVDRLSLKKRVNLLKVGADGIISPVYAHGLPPIIQVEPTNVCNLKCPLCPSGSDKLKRAKGFMSMDIFGRIVDELSDVLISVYLFCFGEPFMHGDIIKMINSCTNSDILTLTSTNGHFIQSMDEALKVVDSGLTTMIIALDGSTQGIYQSYRKGGDIEKVKRCIAGIEEAKARRGAVHPYTVLRAVVNRENQHDLPSLEKAAADLGVNMFSYKSLGCMTQEKSFMDYEPSEGSFRRFEYSGSSRKNRPLIRCPFPFRQPIVFWDGTVVGCEYDHDKIGRAHV